METFLAYYRATTCLACIYAAGFLSIPLDLAVEAMNVIASHRCIVSFTFSSPLICQFLKPRIIWAILHTSHSNYKLYPILLRLRNGHK